MPGCEAEREAFPIDDEAAEAGDAVGYRPKQQLPPRPQRLDQRRTIAWRLLATSVCLVSTALATLAFSRTFSQR